MRDGNLDYRLVREIKVINWLSVPRKNFVNF